MNIDDNLIYEEKMISKGRISFGGSSVKKEIKKVSTGERRDGTEIISTGLMITVFSKLDSKTRTREVLYSGPKIHYRG